MERRDDSLQLTMRRKRYWEMTTKELAEATKHFDEPFVIIRARALTAAEREQWNRLSRNPAPEGLGRNRRRDAMQLTKMNTSETAILSRVFDPEKSTFSAEAARAILALDFNEADKKRMRQLSAKAREGNLSRAEQTAVRNYELVGHILNIMQSKARRSLKVKRHANGNGKTR